MKYLKPKLRGLDKESDMFCSDGSNASGSYIFEKQCQGGFQPDTLNNPDSCSPLGSDDSNDVYLDCGTGTSYGIDSCDDGNNPS